MKKDNFCRNDFKRLMQCLTCANDPETCGCDDSDEDENGMCRMFVAMPLNAADADDNKKNLN